MSKERVAGNYKIAVRRALRRAHKKEKKKMAKRWTYFSLKTDPKIAGVCGNLIDQLDVARRYYGTSIHITSGFRDSKYNKKIGGVKNSSHVKGFGVDIRAPRPAAKREKLLWALGMAGLDRVGVYDRHIHIDSDPSKPNPSYWRGRSK